MIRPKLGAAHDRRGLEPEGYDTAHQRLVGNFPQAFSHVGLINSALNLSRRRAPAVERSTEQA